MIDHHVSSLTLFSLIFKVGQLFVPILPTQKDTIQMTIKESWPRDQPWLIDVFLVLENVHAGRGTFGAPLELAPHFHYFYVFLCLSIQFIKT